MQQFNSGGGRTLWSSSGGVQATGGVEEAVTTASGCGGAAARLQESQAASLDVGGGAVFSAFPRRWTRNRRGWGRHVIRQRRRGDPVAAPRPLLLLLLLSCLLALGEGWILGGACRCYRLHHGCSWQWDFDVDRESSAPAMVFGELGCTSSQYVATSSRFVVLGLV
uniref:Uncharacterized protein n=1 Tax=Oryza barthii TaxID=65489 RepID=A0A0D3HLI0_9ORYZ